MSPSTQRHRYRLQLEALEDRVNPAPPGLAHLPEAAAGGLATAAAHSAPQAAEHSPVIPNPAAGAASQAGRHFVTHLTGSEEVPARETRAQGQAIFHLSKDGTELTFRLIVANITNVVQAHIHVGPEGENGPVVAFLFEPAAPGGGRFSGVLATGTITAADLVGPLAGQPLSALVEQMVAGNTYVNVHTDDGVPPPDTGPGDFPGGEVRGQIRSVGPASTAAVDALFA
jgi:hypothetical protein